MKDGYYYFIPAVAGKTDVDKSLGYVCVTKYPRRSSYSMQCSLSRDAAAPLGVQGTVEIHLSASSYIDEQSILIGRIRLAPKTRLFIDVSLPAAGVESIGPDQYAVVSASGRTLFYSVLEKKHSEGAEASVQTSDAVQAPAQPRQPVPQSGRPQQQAKQQSGDAARPAFRGQEFDPFETTNSFYKWYIYDNRTDSADSIQNIQELDKMLRYFNVQYDLFSRMNGTGNAPYTDTFLKMSYYAVQIAGHVLRGEYTDPESGRKFTIIGLPGWNTQNAAPNSAVSARRRSGRSGRPQQQASSGTTRTIRECSRWLTAKRKPACSYNRNYNGYWLYYFDAESGRPVKATMKSE
ncbi:MAG: hypothetical protein KHX22_08165 [Clostridiales bacterium]|nr:hypothetical protein [Clostridiales bacterium]